MNKVLVKFRVFAMLLAGLANIAIANEEKERMIDELTSLLNKAPMLQLYTRSIADELGDYLSQSGVEVDDKFIEIIKEATDEVVTEVLLDSPLVRDYNYQVWNKHFEVTELRDLIAFFKTPTGKKFLSKIPEIGTADINAAMSVQEEFVFTWQVRILEKLEEAGYGDMSNIFQTYDSDIAKPAGPGAAELADLRRKLCVDIQSAERAVPVYRGSPEYPQVANLYGVEGWVELGFTITEDGYTDNVSILNTSTGSLFNAAAKKAVEGYIYCAGAKTRESSIRIRFEV